MVAAKKKTKKTKNFNGKLAAVMETGKMTMGEKTVVDSLRNSKAKLIIVSNNFPSIRRSQIEDLATRANVPVHYFSGNNVDLGRACGKYFRVSCLSIIDPGDSDIIKALAGDDKADGEVDKSGECSDKKGV